MIPPDCMTGYIHGAMAQGKTDMNTTQNGRCMRSTTCLKTVLLAGSLLLFSVTEPAPAEPVATGRTSSLSTKIFQRRLQHAEAGDSEAQLDVARRLESGKGAKKNPQQAFTWYLKAAENNAVEAQFAVAGMYASGTGIAKDLALARHWYTRAREQGHPLAAIRLSRLDQAEKQARLDAARAAKLARQAEQRKAQARAELAAQRRAEQEARRRAEQAARRKAEQEAQARREQRARQQQQAEEAPVQQRQQPASVTPARLMPLIQDARWSTGGNAVDFLPSTLNRCIAQGHKLSCFSTEREVGVEGKALRYMARSTVELLEHSRLAVSYRYQVTRVRDAGGSLEQHRGPDHPLPQKGWQAPVSYQCRLTDDRTLTCRGNDGKPFSLTATPAVAVTAREAAR